MNERLKILRNRLGLSQDEFGKRIGSARNTIANYELGRRNPSNTVVKAICREFNVNYLWLTEGEGEMFSGTPQSVVDEIAVEYDLDEIDKKIIEKFLGLTKEQRQIIKDYLRSVFAEDVAPGSNKVNIDTEVADYRHDLEIQEEAGEKSLA